MKALLVLDCCSYEVKTNSKTYKYIDCYKLKPKEKLFKKKLADGRPVKRELMLVGICPNCKHYILRFLWYSKSNGRVQDFEETKIIRGNKADEIFKRRIDLYDFIDIPCPFKPKKSPKHSKKIPWTYFKTVDGYSQIPRYLDETEDAGLKVLCCLKNDKC